jgi:hypothetical protein
LAGLFPGVFLPVLCVASFVALIVGRRVTGSAASPWRVWLSRALLLLATVEAAAVVGVLLTGPWRIDLGPLSARASSIDKPAALGAVALLAALLVRPRGRSADRGRWSVVAFYITSALVAWVLTLGPSVKFLGRPTDLVGPYQWLMWLPGIDGLRVPARFWMISVLALSAAMGAFAARVLAGQSRRTIVVALVIAGGGLLADGWVDRIVAAPVPGQLTRASALAGGLVLELPAGDHRDLAAQYRAVFGGWRVVNGYSGNNPRYYPVISEAIRAEDPGVLAPFQEFGDLHVVVPADAPRLEAMVSARPGARRSASGGGWIIYRLPHLDPSPAARREGSRLTPAGMTSSCGSQYLEFVTDGDDRTYWACGREIAERTITVDVGRVATVGTVVHGSGRYSTAVPWQLAIDTSLDGETWVAAWRGSTFGQAIRDSLAEPSSMNLILAFSPREARYVRLSNPSLGAAADWSLVELELWTGR